MTDRQRQRRIDHLAIQFVAAVEASDFEGIDRVWTISEKDPELEAALIETAAELARIFEAEAIADVDEAVIEAVERHMPSADVLRSSTAPLTVGEVAKFIGRHPPADLTSDGLAANERLQHSSEVVPSELGLGEVLAWGQRFGYVSESYWRAFRQTAIKLRMRRDSEVNLQMAARARKPKPIEGNDDRRG